jgi:hypothetical protein
VAAPEANLIRPSTARVKPDPLPRELIEWLLEAAVQAPDFSPNSYFPPIETCKISRSACSVS